MQKRENVNQILKKMKMTWMMTPMMDWMHWRMTVCQHSLVLPLVPYPVQPNQAYRLGLEIEAVLLTDGVLRLHAHEEGGGPALVHGKHARPEVLRQLRQGYVLPIFIVSKVPVDIGNQVPGSDYPSVMFLCNTYQRTPNRVQETKKLGTWVFWVVSGAN